MFNLRTHRSTPETAVEPTRHDGPRRPQEPLAETSRTVLTSDEEARTLEHELRRVDAQVIAAFCPPLAVDDVRAVLAQARAQFATARIVRYVPLLVERAAREALRAELATSATAPTAAG